MAYKIVGKIQEVTFDVDNNKLCLRELSLVPDVEYSFRNEGKNYALLLSKDSSHNNIIAIEFDKYIKLNFDKNLETLNGIIKVNSKISLEVTKDKNSTRLIVSDKNITNNKDYKFTFSSISFLA